MNNKKNKIALIAGITGQDGSYLAELLLDKGYEVHGIIRRSSSFNTGKIDHIFDKLKLHYGDVTDPLVISRLVSEIQPDEIYNLAAQSHVRVSFDVPLYTAQVDAIGTLNILEAMRTHSPNSKMYQACHDTNTKVVTERGIVEYSELKEGDLVYSINIKTKKMEQKPIEKIFEYDYDGEMVVIKNRRIDKMVTPHHKILLESDDGNIFYKESKDIKNLFPYNRQSKHSLVKPELVLKKETGDVDLNSIVDLSNISKNHTKNLLYKMNANDLMYLLGLYIGDGYCKNSKIGCTKTLNKENLLYKDSKGRFKKINKEFENEVEYKSSYIQFAIPKQDIARKKLVNVLKNNNIEFVEHDMTVDFSSFTLSSVFKTSGEGVFNKHIPKWIWELPIESLMYLKDGLIDSDGHTRKKDLRESFMTSSTALLSDAVILFTKLGYFCSIYKRNGGEMLFKSENRYINASDSYIINIAKKQTNKIYKNNIETKKYNGKVWCFQVKDNNNFLVERNGKISFCGNSTSELFGKVVETPQKETTPFYPRSPYGVAKIYGYWIVKNYREAYNLFTCNGVLFNHESPRRGITFVTRKITSELVKIKFGEEKTLKLGNLDAKRDWGHAKEFVEGMWRMLQQDTPDDFVLATGELHSVRECVELAAGCLDYEIEWRGEGIEEKGYDKKSGKLLIEIDPVYFRPSEVDLLLGDPTKAKKVLGWEPKIKFNELIKEIVESDFNQMKKTGKIE